MANEKVRKLREGSWLVCGPTPKGVLHVNVAAVMQHLKDAEDLKDVRFVEVVNRSTMETGLRVEGPDGALAVFPESEDVYFYGDAPPVQPS